jgi:UPF0716 protein FxsA
MGRLFLLFLLVPLAEIYLLIRVGEVIGAPATIGLVIATAFLGAALARREGLRTFVAIQRSVAQGRLPTDDLVEGVMILFAGLVLLTPGFLTDALGFFVLLPPTRRWLRRYLVEWLKRRADLQANIIDVDFR